MTSVWAEWASKACGHDAVETEDGLITYYVENDTCHLVDLYVRENKRDNKVWKSLYDELLSQCNDKQIKKIVTFVNCDSERSQLFLSAYLRHGFKIRQAEKNIIALEKAQPENGIWLRIEKSTDKIAAKNKKG